MQKENRESLYSQDLRDIFTFTFVPRLGTKWVKHEKPKEYIILIISCLQFYYI